VQSTDRPVVDPADPAFYVQPRAAIEWVHAHEPVYRCAPGPHFDQPFWLVSKLEDIRSVENDLELFTRRYGTFLHDREFLTAEHMHDDPRFEGGMAMLPILDPEPHRRVRSAVTTPLSPREVLREWEQRVRETVTRLLDAIDPHEEIDFMDAVAAPLPIDVTCELLGIPREMADEFVSWTNNILGSLEPHTELDWSVVREMFDFVESELDSRRKEPRPDLINHIAHQEEEGSITRDEAIMLVWVTLAAALETTVYLVGGGLLALLEFPDSKQALTERPEKIADGVEEMLRWTTPSRYHTQVATRDTRIRGVEIATGDIVMTNYYFANRDPDVFPDPFRFDVERQAQARTHLSFGHGPHYCVGAALGRLEGRVLFEELLERFPNVALAGEPVYRPTAFANGLQVLPVICEPQ